MKVLANFEDNQKIPTYSSLDTLIGGGFEKGLITQIFGPPGSGKSNIALTLAVNVAKKSKKVVYIDTEGGISIDRVKQIARFDFNKVANNIIVLEPSTFSEQSEDINALKIWLKKHKGEVDLIILDSAVALYRIEDMNNSKLNKELGRQIGLLAKIARFSDVAVVVTNQIYSSFDEENKTVKAVGGTILPYRTKVIIQLEKGENPSERIATLIRHRSIEENKKVNFKITSNGIE